MRRVYNITTKDLTKLLSITDTFSLKEMSYELPSTNEIQSRTMHSKDALTQPDMKTKF